MNANKACGCKGIRVCLLCDNCDSPVIPKEITTYTYCCTCQAAWSDLKDCPNHEGKKIDFPGIELYLDFVTQEEEKTLVSAIEETPWVLSQSGRNKQDYGPKANFKKKKLKCDVFSGLPHYSKWLVERIWQQPTLTNFMPVELCNLEYVPERGSAIDPHFDDFWLWGERLVTLTLLSQTAHTMTKDDLPGVEVIIPLPARSLVVCKGPARYDWKHGIQRSHITEKRIGITLRELTDEFKEGGKSADIGAAVVQKALTFGGTAVGLVDGMVEKQKELLEGIAHNCVVENGDGKGTIQTEEKAMRKQEVMDNDGFQMVSKKKAAKRKRGPAVKAQIEATVQDVSIGDIARLQEELDQYAKEVLQEFNKDFEEIVCYGLGSITRNRVSQYQLALLLKIKESLGGVPCSMYDPMFNTQDKQLLSDLGLEVINTNEEGKRKCERKTLFYMPHCGRPLYNNVLWANWFPECLCKISIAGNSFSYMQQTTPSRIFKKESGYINRILPHIAEQAIANNFNQSDIFNDFAVHHFERTSDLSDEFWHERPQPSYENDPEIILSN